MVFGLLGDMWHDELPSGGEKCGKIMFMALYKNQLSQRGKRIQERKIPSCRGFLCSKHFVV